MGVGMRQAIANAAVSIRRRYGAALQYRDFRNMWLANFSAQAAAWGLIVARAWFVYDAMGMSASVGITTFAALAPALVVPPIAGVLADRFDRRTILAYTYAINLFANLGLASLAFSGRLAVWHVVVLSAVNGIARYTQQPVSQALAANLVPRDTLLNGLSLNAAATHFARLAGAAVVTPLLVLVGPPAAFLACTIFYAIGWIQVMRVRTRSSGGVRAGESFVGSFTGGIRYIASQPLIAMVTILVCFHCGLTMAYESTLPAFARRQLGDPALFGVLITAVGLGSAVGAIYIGGVRSALTRGRLVLAMGLLSGLGLVALAMTRNLAVAYGAAIVMGCNQAAFMTLGQAITQSLAADEFRGRIASINTLSFQGLMAVVNLSNGYFTDAFGAPHVLWVEGGLFVGIMLLSIAVALPRRVYRFGIPAEAHALPGWARPAIASTSG